MIFLNRSFFFQLNIYIHMTLCRNPAVKSRLFLFCTLITREITCINEGLNGVMAFTAIG